MEANLGKDEDDEDVQAIIDSLKGREKTLAFGQETARAILDIIKLRPDLHDQAKWEQKTDCGTTRCIAGWAAFLHPVLMEDTVRQEISALKAGGISRNIEEMARECAFVPVGMKALGLSRGESSLFFTDNHTAVRALEFLAAGQPIDWDVAYGSA